MKLAKAGYGGGDPKNIGQMDVKWVIYMLQYDGYCNEWEAEYLNLNKEDG